MAFGPNLLPNPGAETDTSGWSVGNGSLSRVTTPVRTGTGAFSVTVSAAGNANLIAADVTSGLSPGLTVQISGYVRSAAVARSVTMLVDWYSNTGYVSTTGITGVTSSTTVWTALSGVVTMPAAATKGSMYAQVQSAAASEVHYFDDLSFLADSASTNVAPVANAGPDQTVAPGATVTLTGSASTDSDGTISTYTWSLSSKPGGSTATLSGTGATRTFVADILGSYVGTLTVTDNLGAVSPADTVTVIASTGEPVALVRSADGTTWERCKFQTRNATNTAWIWG